MDIMDIVDIAYKALAVVGAIFMLTGMIGLLTCADGDKLPRYIRFLGSGLFSVMFYLLYIRITESTYNICKPLIGIIAVWAILVQISLLYDKKDRIHNKLCAKYYPIKTESEKTEFVYSNREELKKIISDQRRIAENEMGIFLMDFGEKLKRPISIFGNPKYRNIMYNEVLADKALKNKRFIKINSNISKLDSIAQKIMCGEYENISVDEINYVLKKQKLNRQKTWGAWAVLLIFLVAFIYCFFLR